MLHGGQKSESHRESVAPLSLVNLPLWNRHIEEISDRMNSQNHGNLTLETYVLLVPLNNQKSEGWKTTMVRLPLVELFPYYTHKITQFDMNTEHYDEFLIFQD